MTNPLWFDDCYLKEWSSTVTTALNNEIELDQTAFFPEGGGNPCDQGKIIKDGIEYSVNEVKKREGRIVHVLDRAGLQSGDSVHCILDWERRYKVMRMHTAMHCLIQIMFKDTGALVTGNQIYPDRSRVDVNIENFDRALIEKIVGKANSVIAEGHDVKIYYLPRDEAMKIEGLVKLAAAMPPNLETLRIVEVVGVDIQADGGCHVANTKEIGRLKITKMENKGKSNRRLEFVLEQEAI
ncbi:MAG: alanyl-tRNA editing protein [Candidatus Aenigmarchaeota archaeon]|nr:alanyl-tRNA editing protein [Candidatus Aenigmarchaeota archaeon]